MRKVSIQVLNKISEHWSDYFTRNHFIRVSRAPGKYNFLRSVEIYDETGSSPSIVFQEGSRVFYFEVDLALDTIRQRL